MFFAAMAHTNKANLCERGVVCLPLKSSFRSKSTDNLYEFADEIAAFGNLADKMQAAEDSTDATAAKNAAAKWKQTHGKANPPS